MGTVWMSWEVEMVDVNRGGTPVIVVVAIIGLLSTVGASALGGYWGSKSAEVSAESLERQFESQRTAAIFVTYAGKPT